MGFHLSIAGRTFEAENFTVQEAATPLAAGDSSGQVGTISFTIPEPDPDVQPNHPVTLLGPAALVGSNLKLIDTRKGFTLGKVTSVQRIKASGNLQVTATSRLGELNVYNVQAQPFVGLLSDAFEYYLSLAGVTTDIFVDTSLAAETVVFPGWNGELWYFMKQMAAAIDCDISLVSGKIILRPIRTRTATRGRDIDRTLSVGGGTLAQFIEVYQYNNRPITGELVYPPGGWSEEVTTINVNAGETVEQVLQMNASVSSIVQPTMQTFVSRGHVSSSVFTVVGDDGLPIQPAAWDSFGGSLRVEINPDTVSLTVHITAPTGLPNKDGNEIGVYGIALSDDSSTGRYSTLRIVGTGVAFDKQVRRVPTGVSASETATEVGVTIDNPFLSTRDQVDRAASRAVKMYNGSAMTISGSVVAVNRLGDSGVATTRTHEYVEDLLSGQTYTDVQTLWAGKTYQGVFDDLNAPLEDEFQNQVFGNVNGARIWDGGTARWFRIRNASLLPDRITFEAEDDLTNGDVQDMLSGELYSDVQTRYNGLTYRQVELAGLR